MFLSIQRQVNRRSHDSASDQHGKLLTIGSKHVRRTIGRCPRTRLNGVTAGVDGSSADGPGGCDLTRRAAERVEGAADRTVDELARRCVAARVGTRSGIAVFSFFEDTVAAGLKPGRTGSQGELSCRGPGRKLRDQRRVPDGSWNGEASVRTKGDSVKSLKRARHRERTYVVLSEFEIVLQTLPIEHCEKLVIFFDDIGDLFTNQASSATIHGARGRRRARTHMMKSAFASQVAVVRGQQTGFELARVHPVAQSWIALWRERRKVRRGLEDSVVRDIPKVVT
jgi:hypothetical protein